MIELSPTEFDCARLLFATSPYGALVAGTLEGGHPGRVFVDCLPEPQIGLVCTRVGYYFLSGQPSTSVAEEIARLFNAELIPAQQTASRNPEFLLFYDPPAWAPELLKSLQARRPILIHKKRHTLPAGAEQKLHGWQSRLPGGLHMAPLTIDLLNEHAELREAAESFYGSPERFVQHGFGICLLDGKNVACVCRSVFNGAGEVEVDIYTAEGYRGHGLAFLTASAFIEACLARSLRPVWGCWPENLPSIRLAGRLGFTAEPDQPVCLWVDEPGWNTGSVNP